MAVLVLPEMIFTMEMVNMIKTMVFASLLALSLVRVVAAQTPTQTEATNMPVRWLGKLPADEFFSTRLLNIHGGNGILVTRDGIFQSSNGGSNWNKLDTHLRTEPGGIIDAWLSSPTRLFLLSESSPLKKSASLSITLLSPKMGSMSYFAVGGNGQSGKIVLVGGEGISVTKDRFATLPLYAQDSIGNSPGMTIPVISTSNDEGKTWHSAKFRQAMGYLDGINISGDSGVAWGPYEIFVSSDQGSSWRRAKIDISNSEEDAYPVSASIVGSTAFVSTKSGLFLKGSVVEGRFSTISHISSPLTDLVFVNEQIGYGVFPSDQPKEKREESQLVRTENGGITWAPILKTRRIVALSASHHGLCGASYDQLFCLDFSE
jgi:hypothetical protein